MVVDSSAEGVFVSLFFANRRTCFARRVFIRNFPQKLDILLILKDGKSPFKDPNFIHFKELKSILY